MGHHVAMTVELTPLALGDLVEVAALEADLFGDIGWTIADWWRAMQDARFAFAAIRDGNSILAYGATMDQPRDVVIANVGVRESVQGRGYGRTMTLGLIDIAIQRRAQRLVLQVVPANAVAIHIYESLGFAADRMIPNYYGRGRPGLLMSVNDVTLPSFQQRLALARSAVPPELRAAWLAEKASRFSGDPEALLGGM